MVVVSRSVTVVMYKPVVDQFRGWSGPIGLSIKRLARIIQGSQIAFVEKRTGLLARSISTGRQAYTARGISIEVGASAGSLTSRFTRGYAMSNEVGAIPHKIVPRKPGGMLVFYWAKVGHVVRFRSVNHPGNQGYRWAERGLAAGMSIWQRSG